MLCMLETQVWHQIQHGPPNSPSNSWTAPEHHQVWSKKTKNKTRTKSQKHQIERVSYPDWMCERSEASKKASWRREHHLKDEEAATVLVRQQNEQQEASKLSLGEDNTTIRIWLWVSLLTLLALIFLNNWNKVVVSVDLIPWMHQNQPGVLSEVLSSFPFEGQLLL